MLSCSVNNLVLTLVMMCQKVGGREQNLDQGSLGLTGSPVSVIEPHIYSWSESITQRPIVLKAAGYFVKSIIVIS